MTRRLQRRNYVDMGKKNNPGAAALAAWIDAAPDRSRNKIAKRLDVTRQAVGLWAAGKSVPSWGCRRALAILCGIPAETWDTEEQRMIDALESAVKEVAKPKKPKKPKKTDEAAKTAA